MVMISIYLVFFFRFFQVITLMMLYKWLHTNISHTWITNLWMLLYQIAFQNPPLMEGKTFFC